MVLVYDARVSILFRSFGSGVFSLNNKLYVGNLNYRTNSAELEQLFAAYGTVKSVQVISDRHTGQSKGFGFVEMGTAQEAQAAMTALNGKDFNGRNLTVNEARPQTENGNRSGGAPWSPGGRRSGSGSGGPSGGRGRF